VRGSELDRLGAEVVEQPDTVTQEDGRQVDLNLVHESSSEALLSDAPLP
jgi:hypothetical protein